MKGESARHTVIVKDRCWNPPPWAPVLNYTIDRCIKLVTNTSETNPSTSVKQL